mgnify:CR=1 FL=1
MQLAANRLLDGRFPARWHPGLAARDASATKAGHLLLFDPTPRPQPSFRENRRPSACSFRFAIGGVVGRCRPKVVDGPVSRRASHGAGGLAPDGPRMGGRCRGIAVPGCVPARTPESFSEIVLASPSEFPYNTSSHGGVAQLGERLTGSQEVRGSIPLVSTRALNEAPTQVGAFFHIGTQGQRRHHDPPGRQDRKKLRRARPL